MYRLLKIVSLIMLIPLVFFIGGCSEKSGDTATKDNNLVNTGNNVESITVYSGAGLRKPIEELGKMFQEKTGVEVQFTYGGTAQLISQILMIEKGDVFLPGDVEELTPLREKNKIAHEKSVVYHIPILAVPQGNPSNIKSLADLAQPGVKVVLGDPEANPIGKLANKVLKDNGLFAQVEPNVVARAMTVNEMFAYIAMQQVDASIIWEDNLIGNEKIEMVPTAEFDNYIKEVPAVSLQYSEHPELAEQFVDFVASADGIKVWQKWGFKPTAEVK